MTAPTTTTIGKIVALLHQLSEGDRARVQNFCRGILESRQQKKFKRRSRFAKAAIDDWQIGK